MTELPGGYVNKVVRVGDTVRRPMPKGAEFVHALLEHFEAVHWTGPPRFLGVDDLGREILAFIPGYVGWLGEGREEPPEVWEDASMVRVAELVREFHDLTAGTPLAAGCETVCHNDLAPRNTVYQVQDGFHRPTAFIDWDLAAPGARGDDVAMMCADFTFATFIPGWPEPEEFGRRVRLMSDAYGLADRSRLAQVMVAQADAGWRRIAAGAAAGDEASIRLRDLGAVESVRACHQWLLDHRMVIERAML